MAGEDRARPAFTDDGLPVDRPAAGGDGDGAAGGGAGVGYSDLPRYEWGKYPDLDAKWRAVDRAFDDAQAEIGRALGRLGGDGHAAADAAARAHQDAAAGSGVGLPAVLARGGDPDATTPVRDADAHAPAAVLRLARFLRGLVPGRARADQRRDPDARRAKGWVVSRQRGKPLIFPEDFE